MANAYSLLPIDELHLIVCISQYWNEFLQTFQPIWSDTYDRNCWKLFLRSIHNGINVKSEGERADSRDHLFTTKEHRQCVSTTLDHTIPHIHDSSYDNFQSETTIFLSINWTSIVDRLFGENEIRNILKAIQP